MADGIVIIQGMPFKAVDNGDGTFSLDVNADLAVSDLEIGAVELKNGASDTRAVVAAGNTLAAADAALAVGDPTQRTLTGIVTETAPATDTASSGLNGRLQRIAQHLTTLLAAIAAKITVIIAGAGGTPVQLDDTDKLAVSLYGKGAAAGDIPLELSTTGIITLVGTGALNDASAVNAYMLNRSDDSSAILSVAGALFNNSTWDKPRNNHEVTVLASAARTASVDSADLTNYNGRGVIVVVDVTAVPGVDTITVAIQGKSALGSDYYAILTSAALVATGVVVLVVYPGVTVAANLAASHPLPRLWRVSVTASGVGSFTYSISGNYIN